MHVYSLFLCSPAFGHPTFPSNNQESQRAVFGAGVDRDRVLVSPLGDRRGRRPLRTEPSVLTEPHFPSLPARLAWIKAPFSTATLLQMMVQFWVYTVEWESKNRLGLLNRMREKRDILLCHGLAFPWFITLKVYGVWRQLFHSQFSTQIAPIATLSLSEEGTASQSVLDQKWTWSTIHLRALLPKIFIAFLTSHCLCTDRRKGRVRIQRGVGYGSCPLGEHREATL